MILLIDIFRVRTLTTTYKDFSSRTHKYWLSSSEFIKILTTINKDFLIKTHDTIDWHLQSENIDYYL